MTPGQALAAGGRGGGRRRRFFTRLQTSTPAPGTLTCRVTGTVSSWNSGPTANLTLTNTGITAINGGFLAFTLPGGQVVPFGWNTACAPASGWMRAKSVTRNGTIVPGASAGIGFQAARTGDTASPDWCSLQRHGLCR
ncbi:cellulose binding domain-containing protein [Streptomyces sp. NBC_01451]|uniref:cellulose binding domain-containing protein n=1 Tax=Streptomyces sp. NBC_01451 TaxID=2903872 RepID=UPI002E2F9EC4|nr:cellulose binding domain-containing protein [Streptomyces sp. NBC_01451]